MQLSKAAEALLRVIGRTERCEIRWRNGVDIATQELVRNGLARIVLKASGDWIELTDAGIDAADDLADEDQVNEQFNKGGKK